MNCEACDHNWNYHLKPIGCAYKIGISTYCSCIKYEKDIIIVIEGVEL